VRASTDESGVLSEAVVIAHFGRDVEVALAGGERRRVRVPRGESLVVGDAVSLLGQGLERRPRRTVLARRDARQRTRVIAANLDALGIVISSAPPAPRGYVDRAIAAARAAGVEPFVVVNKCDLPESARLAEAARDAYARSRSPIPVFAVSAKTGEGLDGLRLAFSSRSLRGAFVGTSGVGKSSLVNALLPGLALEVGKINRFTRLGRHVTTRSTLHALPGGGELIDTPGFRDFVPADLGPAGLAAHFPGFERALEKSCRFRDCRHRDEPDCSVLAAVQAGGVDAERHETYLALLAELERDAERLATGARS
jgi:ribosome biogenesis GTPase